MSMPDEAMQVWVGAFGKHPGWDDHIADQGLETEFLVRVRQLLYVEGIGGNLDAGAWDELEEHERISGFDHVFLWRSLDGLAVGRMWSSSDGKGRTRYPMIVCAQARGITCDWLVGPCLNRLEALAHACRSTGNAGEVIAAIDRTRSELRALGRGAPPARREALDPPAALAHLADRCASRMGQDGLVRVAYQLEREFTSFLLPEDPDSGTRSRTVDVRPRHMRVPACEDDAGSACALWMKFLYERVDPAAPALVFARVGAPYADLVVGDPVRGQIFCFQASPKRVPSTTEIPYNVDEEFRARLETRVERARAGELRDEDPGRVFEEAPRARRASPERSSRTKVIAIVAVAVIAVIALAWFAFSMMGGNGGGAPTEREGGAEVDKPADRSTDRTVPPSGEQAEGFRAWCLAHHDWFSRVLANVKSGGEALGSDEYLSEHVRAPLAEAMASKVELNPRYVVSNPPATARELAENMPDEVGSAAVVAATVRARSVIDSVAGALERWPLRQDALTMASSFESLGWAGPASELRGLAGAVMPGVGADIDAAAAKLIAAMGRAGLGAVVDAARRVSDDLEALSRAGDRVLDAGVAELRTELAGLASAPTVEAIVARSAEIESVAGITADTRWFVESGWAGVDRELFMAESPVYGKDAGSARGAARLRSWLTEAQREVYVAIDPGDDPRQGLSVSDDIGQLTAQLDEMGPRGAAEFASDLARLRGRLESIAERGRSIGALRWSRPTQDQIRSGAEQLGRDLADVQREIGTLRAAISADVAEQIAELRSRSSVSSDGLAVIDQIWVRGRDGLLARYESERDDRALVSRASELARVLGVVEQASRIESRALELPVGWNGRPIRDLELRARAEALERHAGQIDRDAANEQRVREIEQAIRDAMRTFQTGEEAAISVLRDAAAHVALTYGVEEPWGDGRTIAGVVKQAETGAVVLPVDELAPELSRALVALRGVEAAGTDRAKLLGLVESGTGFGGARVRAWLALGSGLPVWPGGGEELRSDLRALGDARSIVEGLSDQQRRSALSRQLDDEIRRRWAVAVDHASDWEDLSACVRLREQCGGEAGDLSPRAAFALEIIEARQKIEPGKDDAPNRQLAGRLIDRAAALGLNASTGPFAELLASLNALVAEDPDAVPPLDPAGVGPGRVGWVVDPASTEDRLIYHPPAVEGVRLEFRLVELPDGRASYLGTEEVSVGVASALVESDPQAGAGLVELLGWIEPRDDRRPGMHVWGWLGSADRPRVVASAWWLAGWWAPEGYYMPGFDAGRPSPGHPVQRLALADAVYLAGRLGCRLPTVEEWQAGYAATAVTEPSGGWNLRDATVAAQLEHLRAFDPSGQKVRRPDADAFGQLTGGEPCYPFNDGALWVGPVTGGPQSPFRQIVGNVMEYVIVQWDEEARAVMASGTDPRDRPLKEWVDAVRGVKAGVVGGVGVLAVRSRSGVGRAGRRRAGGLERCRRATCVLAGGRSGASVRGGPPGRNARIGAVARRGGIPVSPGAIVYA